METFGIVDQIIKKEWDKACKENTTQAYYRFLNQFPNSPYTKQSHEHLDLLKEERIFTMGIKEKSMREYLSSYPNGKFYNKALEHQSIFKKRNRKRAIITAIFVICVIICLILQLKDVNNTYHIASLVFIKMVILEGLLLILFNIKKFYIIHLLALPLILPICSFNLSPKVEIINREREGVVRYPLFYRVKDDYGKVLKVVPCEHYILNHTSKDLYITHALYNKLTYEVTGTEKIERGRVKQTSPISIYFEEPPYSINMDEIVTKTRRGHTSYKTIHHETWMKNVLDYRAYE